MRRFVIKANTEIEAKNIEEAFIKLSKYFGQLADAESDFPDPIFLVGEITITPKSEIK